MAKRFVVLSAMALFLAQSLFAFDPEELNKVTFNNNTSKSITSIFFAPSDSGEWGPELLGAETTLDAKTSRSFFIHYPDATGAFDIMAIDENGKTLTLMGFGMQDGTEAFVNLTSKNMKEDMPELEFITLNVRNDTGYDLHYLFLSPADSAAWGADVLDEETILSKGETLRLLVPASGSPVDYNLMTADEDGDLYQLTVKLNPKKGSEQTVSIKPSHLQ